MVTTHIVFVCACFLEPRLAVSFSEHLDVAYAEKMQVTFSVAQGVSIWPAHNVLG